jgi:hypothetical protein
VGISSSGAAGCVVEGGVAGVGDGFGGGCCVGGRGTVRGNGCGTGWATARAGASSSAANASRAGTMTVMWTIIGRAPG